MKGKTHGSLERFPIFICGGNEATPQQAHATGCPIMLLNSWNVSYNKEMKKKKKKKKKNVYLPLLKENGACLIWFPCMFLSTSKLTTTIHHTSTPRPSSVSLSYLFIDVSMI